MKIHRSGQATSINQSLHPTVKTPKPGRYSQVLAARVQQEETVGADSLVSGFGGSIVDDSTVGAV